jgi:hypothetical protein
MTIHYVAPLQRGWERMRGILLQRFDLATWLVLGFTAWLAFLGEGGGGVMFNLGDNDNRGEVVEAVTGAWDSLAAHAFLLPLAVVAMLLGVALVVAVTWLSSRGKLIFLDNVVHGRALVALPWQRFKRLGDSLFLWRLGFGLVCVVVVVAVLALILGPAVAAGSWRDPFVGLSIAAAIIGGTALALFALAAGVVSLLLDNFVVPVMYRYDLPATAAWRALLPWLQAYPGHFVLYALFVLVLALFLGLCMTLVCVLTCFACCLWLVPLLGSYVMTVILLPLWTTYRAFTVEWLAQLDPKFDLFAWVRATAVTDSESP